MESANSHHHHHQLQDQLVGSSASSIATPSCDGVGFTTTHSWPPTPFLNSNSFSSYPSEIKQQENNIAVSSQLYSSMAPGTAFSWANNPPTNLTTNHHYDQDLQQHSRIKDEFTDQYYRRYSEMLSSSPQSSADELSLRNELSDLQANEVATKFLFKSFPFGNLMNSIHFSPAADLYSNSTSAAANPRGFAQIFPSINVSSLNQAAVTSPGSSDMNLEALDLLASSRFSGRLLTSSQNQIGILRDGFSNYGFDLMPQSHQIPFYGSNKVSSASRSSVVESKRSSSSMESKARVHAPKKSRLEARSSCPPFKVRKEKLGDRIAALQQLVAPFGKTDTASVLMEAIGYIKFLQSQVETLSVPYMKASRNKPNRVTKGVYVQGPAEIENEATKRDLKSRGLCLVPLTWLSYISDGSGAAVWPPPQFGGAT